MYGQTAAQQQMMAYAAQEQMMDHVALRLHNMQLFRRQLSRSVWQKVWGRLTGRPHTLKSLNDIPQQQVTARRYAGVWTIDLARIQGSEGRVGDFDAHFHPLRLEDRDRWVGVATAVAVDKPMPPISVVFVNGCFYVRDGHHRVSVAMARGQATIEAEVTAWEIA